MSRRMQILVPESDYREIIKAAKEMKVSVSEWVRDLLKQSLARKKSKSPDEKIARVLKFARFAGPTGDIDEMLSEIEKGRDA